MSSQIAVVEPSNVLRAIDLCPRLAPSTKAQYRKALGNFLATGANLGDADALADHARTLPTSSRAFLKAAVKLVTEQMSTALKGQATPENVKSTQAALYRLEALQVAIEVKASKGTKAHTWLTASEVKRLLATCGPDLRGQRDKIVLALLVGAGLRRAEAAALIFADVILQPRGDKMRTCLQVMGKGSKSRVVPISDALANLVDQWAAIVGGDGFILRSIDQTGAINGSLSSSGIFGIVRKRGAMIGKPDLAPHDLRRSYAQLGYDAGVPLTQISTLLGHSSVQTTQRYLNLSIDLETTASDFVPLE